MLVNILSHPRLSWVVLTLHFITWMGMAQLLSVTPDMADHWVWSRQLFLSYYEHPPMVAVFFKIVTVLFGNSPEAIELGSVLVNIIILTIGYKLCKRFFNQTAANIYLLILVSTPYFTAGSQFMHIDQPYMIFWLLNIGVMKKFIETKNSNWLLVIGVVAGLGALSKYTTILFYISVFVWAMIRPEHRLQFLKRIQFYFAGVISLIVFSPVLIWNYQNNWVSFKFQFGRGLSGAGFGENFGNFTLGHLTTFSLIFTFLLWFLVFRKKLISKNMSEQSSLLVVLGLVPATFFTISSLRGAIADAHWLNVSYLALFMLLAHYIYEQLKSKKWTALHFGGALISSHILNIVIVGLFMLQGYFGIYKIAPELDPITKSFGWEISSQQIDQLLKQKNIEQPKFVMSREYQLSGVLSLYLKGQPLSFSYEKPERNQWSPLHLVKSSPAILVCPPLECPELKSRMGQDYGFSFESVGEVETFIGDRRLRTLQVYQSQGL